MNIEDLEQLLRRVVLRCERNMDDGSIAYIYFEINQEVDA